MFLIISMEIPQKSVMFVPQITFSKLLLQLLFISDNIFPLSSLCHILGIQ